MTNNTNPCIIAAEGKIEYPTSIEIFAPAGAETSPEQWQLSYSIPVEKKLETVIGIVITFVRKTASGKLVQLASVQIVHKWGKGKGTRTLSGRVAKPFLEWLQTPDKAGTMDVVAELQVDALTGDGSAFANLRPIITNGQYVFTDHWLNDAPYTPPSAGYHEYVVNLYYPYKGSTGHTVIEGSGSKTFASAGAEYISVSGVIPPNVPVTNGIVRVEYDPSDESDITWD